MHLENLNFLIKGKRIRIPKSNQVSFYKSSQMIKAMNNQIDHLHKSSQMIKIIINMIGEDN